MEIFSYARGLVVEKLGYEDILSSDTVPNGLWGYCVDIRLLSSPRQSTFPYSANLQPQNKCSQQIFQTKLNLRSSFYRTVRT